MSIERKLNDEEHEKDLERIRNFRLLDDDFMTKVFEDKACAELLVQITLERDDLMIRQVITQRDTKNLQGRSLRLDIFAVDAGNRVVNVEVQRADKGAGFKRARYHSSLLDTNITDPGDELQNLDETYMVMITENDVIGKGLPIYHLERVILETGEIVPDESHIIYVNSQITDDTALGRLMHDFRCTDAKDMYYKVLADRVRYFKEDEKGVASMCKAIEDMRNEVAAEATAKATRETMINIARSMIAAGKLGHDEIAQYTSLMLSEIQQLAAEMQTR